VRHGVVNDLVRPESSIRGGPAPTAPGDISVGAERPATYARRVHTDLELSATDLAYIRAEYRTLDDLCELRPETPAGVHRLIDEHWLPQATYVLADGAAMFPPDYFALVDHAGGPDELPGYFRDRYTAAAEALGLPADDAEETWDGYLSGQFGICLWAVTPEGMAKKAQLIAVIEGLLSAPARHDPRWRAALRSSVDALDDLERPFTDYDRQRWGAVSKDRHVTAVRREYPDVFGGTA
jgi:AcrR family transcriptional regulator